MGASVGRIGVSVRGMDLLVGIDGNGVSVGVGSGVSVGTRV
jgi:hypothetical protein